MLDEEVKSRSDWIHRIHWTRTDSDGKVHVLFVRDLEKGHPWDEGVESRSSCWWNPSDPLETNTDSDGNRFYLMTRLPVAQVASLKSTRLHFLLNFSTRFHWTPGFAHWNLVESIGHVWRWEYVHKTAQNSYRCCYGFLGAKTFQDLHDQETAPWREKNKHKENKSKDRYRD